MFEFLNYLRVSQKNIDMILPKENILRFLLLSSNPFLSKFTRLILNSALVTKCGT